MLMLFVFDEEGGICVDLFEIVLGIFIFKKRNLRFWVLKRTKGVKGKKFKGNL